MNDAAIAKALEVAVARRVRGRRADETARQDAMRDFADELAAFHDELAKNGLLFLPFSDGSGDACIDNMDLLAAAVRRVAGGG